MADAEAESVLQLIEAALSSGKLKKGTNEVTKALERGSAKLVVIAKDVSPPEITMHIPLLAREKNIPCVEVPSRLELGAAAGISKPTASVAILDAGSAKDMLKQIVAAAEK